MATSESKINGARKSDLDELDSFNMTFELENLSSIHTTTHIHTQSKFEIFHKKFQRSMDYHGKAQAK